MEPLVAVTRAMGMMSVVPNLGVYQQSSKGTEVVAEVVTFGTVVLLVARWPATFETALMKLPQAVGLGVVPIVAVSACHWQVDQTRPLDLLLILEQLVELQSLV